MSDEAPRAARERGGEEPPPVLGSWRNLYLLVVAVLAAIIALLAWLTRAFA
jgi:hypothetical protein